MKLFDRILRRCWERWYNGSALLKKVETQAKIIAELEQRIVQLEAQLEANSEGAKRDNGTKIIHDLLSDYAKLEAQDSDFYINADDVVQKEYINANTAIIKVASTVDNVLHIKICRTPREINRIRKKDMFGVVISRSQARAFSSQVLKLMKENFDVLRVLYSEFTPTHCIRIAITDANDLNPYVQILKIHKKKLAETIQWKRTLQ